MAKVSIIIPCKEVDPYTERCIRYCEDLPEEKEILVVTDLVCAGLPAAKRNYAMQRATGDFFAFIDSDAYPDINWLTNAIRLLRYESAVCGPGVLPPDAPFEEQVADKVHQWMFCKYRVTAQPPRRVKWYPTFNLIVRRGVATQFDNYLTGEDDKFCGRILSGIAYDPDILVYHNRRAALRPLWVQFATWGRHKGAFTALSFIAWITTVFVYTKAWISGFIRRKP